MKALLIIHEETSQNESKWQILLDLLAQHSLNVTCDSVGGLCLGYTAQRLPNCQIETTLRGICILYIYFFDSHIVSVCVSLCVFVCVCAFTINATVSLLVLKHKWLGALEVLGPMCLQYIIYATFHVVWLWLISTFLFLIHFDCVPFRLQCSKVLLVDKCI